MHSAATSPETAPWRVNRPRCGRTLSAAPPTLVRSRRDRHQQRRGRPTLSAAAPRSPGSVVGHDYAPNRLTRLIRESAGHRGSWAIRARDRQPGANRCPRPDVARGVGAPRRPGCRRPCAVPRLVRGLGRASRAASPASQRAKRLRFGRHRVALLPHHCRPQGVPHPPCPAPGDRTRGKAPAQGRRTPRAAREPVPWPTP